MTDVTVTSADGTELAARSSGAGSPIVLVHGWWGSVDAFSFVEPHLAERHEVWTYSRRGYPGSAGGADVGPATHVEDMWAVVEAAGGDVHVCGWSGGAVIALLASQGASSLRSVLLYEPPLSVDAEMMKQLLDAMESAREAGGPDAVLETFFAVIEEPADPLRDNRPVWRALQASIPATLDEARALGGALTEAHPPQPPDVPTLWLHGAESTNEGVPTPDAVASMLPSAKLRALEGQRHFAPILDPAGFANAILEFTSALDAKAGP